MKKILITILIVLTKVYAMAQPVNISDLNIPTSPAFVLLDKSPASIEKPTNPKVLGVSLINIWEGSGAIEFTPYWFADHPNYTFDKDLKNKCPFFQTFAFSVASAKNDTTSLLSGGFRTQFYRRFTNETIHEIDSIKNLIVNALAVSDFNKADTLKGVLKDVKAKINFNVELAGAYSGIGKSNNDLSANKYGVWLNIRYRGFKFPLVFTVVGRYTSTIGNKTDISKDPTFFDYGINASYQMERYDIQIEYVNRRDKSAKKNYDRLVLVANYQVAEGIIAVASLGKDFDNIDNVFTAFGVKFGLSKEKAKLK